MNKKRRQKKYYFYDSKKWLKACFDKNSGGYVVINKQRIKQSVLSKNEREKFIKELKMSFVFAKNGYEIELLEETPRIPSPDVRINGILADLKKVSSHNNIVKEAKDAVHRKGAEIVLFEFEVETEKIYKEIFQLQKIGIHGKYYFTNNSKVYEF